jgi:hypothetical protein
MSWQVNRRCDLFNVIIIISFIRSQKKYRK